MPTPEEIIAKFKAEKAAREAGEDISKDNNISEQDNAVLDATNLNEVNKFSAPTTNELVSNGDPNDIIKNDSNSVDNSFESEHSESVESRGPGNDRDELNPSVDVPQTHIGNNDNRFPVGHKRIIVPNDFMGQIATIMKDSGADTRSQSTSLVKIEELIKSDFVDESHRGEFVANTPQTLTEGNANDREITGTTKVPKHSEIPGPK